MLDHRILPFLKGTLYHSPPSLPPLSLPRLVAKPLLHRNVGYRDLVAEKARAGPDMTVDLPIACGATFMTDSRAATSDEVIEVPPPSGPTPLTSGAAAGDATPDAAGSARSSPLPDHQDPCHAPHQPMTLHRLRRLNHIMEYMEGCKLVSGLNDITKVRWVWSLVRRIVPPPLTIAMMSILESRQEAFLYSGQPGHPCMTNSLLLRYSGHPWYSGTGHPHVQDVLVQQDRASSRDHIISGGSLKGPLKWTLRPCKPGTYVMLTESCPHNGHS